MFYICLQSAYLVLHTCHMKRFRLEQHNSTSLELRRLHGDLVMYYKFMFACIECNFNDFSP